LFGQAMAVHGSWQEAEFGGAPRFVDVRMIGRGGLGTVHAAFDRARNERVAIKSAGGRGDLVMREFRLLQSVRHPNVLRVHDLFEGEDEVAFSAELLEGVTLGEYVRGIDRNEWLEESVDELLDTFRGFAPSPSSPATARRLAFEPGPPLDVDRV